ncbi:MAG: sulfotransferase domain-containing protein [Gemmatimonadota bacterium]
MKLPGGWSPPARALRLIATSGARALGRPGLGHILPDFLLIGAMKAGTSFVFASLAAHPHIIRSRRREIHFFGSRFSRGVPWYRTHFPTGLEMRRYQAITGEGSTSYLANPDSPARIRSVLPEVKMIALLRDPVDRAISNYFHEQRTGRETLPIAEAFRAEESRRVEMGLGHLSYRTRGLYAEQLERYYTLFPREQILVLRSETLFAEPAKVMAQVCRFIGVDSALDTREYEPRNVGGYDPAKVPVEVYEALTAFYAPHNERLYSLLGRDMKWRPHALSPSP